MKSQSKERRTRDPQPQGRLWEQRWRQFTAGVQALSRRTPFSGESAAIDDEWDEAAREQDWGFGTGDLEAELPGGLSQLRAPASAQTQRLSPRPRLTRKVIAILVLVSVVIGFCGTVNLLGLRDALAAARDARVQAATIETILHGGGLTQTATLEELKAYLQATDRDLQRIQSDLPVEPVLEHTPGISGPIHALRMATDLVEGGIYGVDAGITVLPHLKALLTSVTGSSSATPSGSASAGPLTLADIQHATDDINAATPLVQQALVERAQVSDSDLRAVGLSSLINTLHKLDGVAPQLPTYFGYARTALSALPTLIGIGKPISYLLFDVDSDELRATGGFQGVYGVLTLSKGALTGGVHLQNIYTLDCPAGFPDCPTTLVPSRFSWFNADPLQFALRDANQDPDYPTTARYDEQLFNQEGGPPVAGVITITPAFVEQILHVTGPISVPQFGQTVTEQNLQELIHYYHAAYAYAGDTTRKLFDAEAGAAMLQKVATLSSSQQSQIEQEAIKEIKTRDLQIYLNDPNMERVLSKLGVDGAVQSPAGGDSLAVVDTNIGATYANADVKETLTDTVTLDAQGTATHNLDINYHFPYVQHSYPTSVSSYYADFLRVIVPNGAHLTRLQNCGPEGSTQAGHAVWSCRLFLGAPADVTVHVAWTVPKTVTHANGASQYSLVVQRQAGTTETLALTISPPRGSSLVQPLPSPLILNSSKQAQYSASLTEDQTLTVPFAP